jgi:hypothetical protein
MGISLFGLELRYMSKRKERKRLMSSLRSLVVPGVRVWLSKIDVDNGKFGYRRVYQAWVWDPKKETRYMGLTVCTWETKDLPWEVLQALYAYGLTHKGRTFIKTAYYDKRRIEK